MAKAADAIGLAVLRAPAPSRAPTRDPREDKHPRPRRRRHLRLRFGRLMFSAAIAYLVGAGAIGELQLLHVQAQEHATLVQLERTNAQSSSLRHSLQRLQSRAGEAQAVRQVLRYAPTGASPVVVEVHR